MAKILGLHFKFQVSAFKNQLIPLLDRPGIDDLTITQNDYTLLHIMILKNKAPTPAGALLQNKNENLKQVRLN